MRRDRYGPWQAALAATLLAAATLPAAPPPKADKDVDAYVQSLTQKIADSHALIRDSARDALVAIGKPALPALRKAAKGDDADAAEAAKQLIAKFGDDAPPDDPPADPRDRRGPPGSGRFGPPDGPPGFPGFRGGPPGPPPGAPTGANRDDRRDGRHGDKKDDGQRDGRRPGDGRDSRDGRDGWHGFRNFHRGGPPGFCGSPRSRDGQYRHGRDGWDGHRRGFPGSGPGGRRDGRDGFRGPRDGRDGDRRPDGNRPPRDDRGPGPNRPGPDRFGPPPGRGNFANPPGPGRPRSSDDNPRDQNLTDRQKSRLEDLIKGEDEKMSALIEKMHADFVKSLKEILNDNQTRPPERERTPPPGPGGFPTRPRGQGV